MNVIGKLTLSIHGIGTLVIVAVEDDSSVVLTTSNETRNLALHKSLTDVLCRYHDTHSVEITLSKGAVLEILSMHVNNGSACRWYHHSSRVPLAS
jgi:hypothetical protein